MRAKRRLLAWLLALVVVLFAGWWGVDTFVLSSGIEGGGPGGDDPIERPDRADGTGDAREEAPASAGRIEQRPVRLAGSSGTSVAGRATPAPDGVGLAAATRGSSSESDEERVTSGDVPPLSTGVTRGDDVIVSNTWTTPPDDEVWVPPGHGWIGTPTEQVEGLLTTRVENVPFGLRYEAPRHSVEMEGFWIERTEVTNHRYFRFLNEAAWIEFHTPLGTARTPNELVMALVGPRAPLNWDVETTARQMVEANLAAVHAAVPELVVRDPATRGVDEEATWANLRDAKLPNGLRLRWYDRAPPAPWPDERYTAGRGDHPVRGLSLDDATAFCLWAGRHVPTEIEWEYAARGTRGVDFPWGDRARQFGDLVNGGTPFAHDEPPDTLPVTTLPGGASWVGALHMLGNVAEWTSSLLLPYPGSDLGPLEAAIRRGGSAADEDRLLVRPAFRGWKAGSQLQPVWNRPEPWVGLRPARYVEPVRSRVVAMHTRYLANPELPPEALEERVFAGAQGRLDRIAFEPRQDPTVRRGIKSVAAQPLRYVVLPASSAPGSRLPDEIVDEGKLQLLSETYLVLFGLLHVDFRVLDTWAVELRAGRKPRLRRGSCPPGTWLVGLHQGHLALVDPVTAALFYVTRTPAGRAVVGVHRRTPRRDGGPHLAASLTSPRAAPKVEVGIELPLGNAAGPDLVVRVRFDLAFEAEVLRVVRDWEVGALDR